MLTRGRVSRTLAGLLLAASWMSAATLPRKPADLTVKLPGGKQLQLSQYKGKVVAVIFILTTCPHCQKTIGFLSKLQRELGPRGFQVLAEAIEPGANTHVQAFVKQFDTPFEVGSGDPMAAIDWMQHPPMLGPHMPMLAFVDKQGMVRSQYEGDDETFFNDLKQEQNLRNQIEPLLKEGAGGPARKTPAPKTPASKTKSGL